MGGTDQGWDESGISLELNILEILNMNRIKYEYSLAFNYIRILNSVEILCQDVASSHGHGYKPEPKSSASWPYVSIFLFTF